MLVQWFPGHMAKAQRMIREHLKLVDVVVELLDARIPASSANPVIKDIVGDKPRVIALNKADLAESAATQAWSEYFRIQGLPVVELEAVSGKGAKQLVSRVEQLAAAKMKAWTAKGVRPRAVRVMILGIPNVGKSSLINRLLGVSVVRTADRPGVTRGKQWIKIGGNLELLDTPGVLWPKFEDPEVGFKLAVTGGVSDEVYDQEQVVMSLLGLLSERYPDRLISRFNLTGPLPPYPEEVLAQIAARRGCLRAGGLIDADKTRKIILTEFRSGKLGPFTLDLPPNTR